MAPAGKERLQHFLAFCLQNAAYAGNGVVKMLVRGQKVNAATAAILNIVRAKNARLNTRQNEGTRAHGTGLQRHIKRAAR